MSFENSRAFHYYTKIACFAACGSLLAALSLSLLVSSNWLPFILAAGIVLLYFYVFRKQVLSHPKAFLEADTLFLLLFAAYALLVPTFYMLTAGNSDIALELKVMLCIGAGLAGVGLGFSNQFGRSFPRHVKQLDGRWNRKEAVQAAVILMILGLALLGILISRVGLATYTQSAYVEGYSAGQGLGFLEAGATIVEIGLFVLFLAYAEKEQDIPVWIWILLALFAFAIFRVGRRRIVVETAIGLLTAYHFYVRQLRLRKLLTVAALAILILVFVGQARSFLQEGLHEMLTATASESSVESTLLAFQELETTHLSLFETIRSVPVTQPYQYGGTYLQAFKVLVPLALDPNRPLAPSQEFAWDYNPEIARAGGAYGFSSFSEGYLNFGFLGVALAGYTEGVFVIFLVSLRRTNPASKGRLLLYTVAVTSFIMIFRGDFASLLKGYVVLEWIPAIFIALWLGRGFQLATSEAGGLN
jgi:hypothetical protein